jgi:hypothetical protein
MTSLQAFLLGMMVAWTPSLVLLWLLSLRAPFSGLEDQRDGASEKPA